MKVYNINSCEETLALAKKLAATLRAGDIIAYRGGLGAGKTTFTKGLADGLGITTPVSSPTFALINEYQGDGLSLYHFDMYRVEDFSALSSTGFFDYLDSDGVLAIEWSENIVDELPDGTIFVTLALVEGRPQARRITIEGGRL